MRHLSLVFVFALAAAAVSCVSNGRHNNNNNGGADMSVPCTGLACQIVHDCPGGVQTTLSGTVYAPNGTLPLYNAIVFVPGAPLDGFTPGVTCDRCDGKVSGEPIAMAQTGPDGKFVLQNVPSGSDIPLVVQVGRWRRLTTVPAITSCIDNPITDPQVTRLPRSHLEGDMPQIAIASGSADPFECLLRKIGIADSEWSNGNGAGKMHFYKENGLDFAGGATPSTALWSDVQTLMKYDLVILPCEAGPNTKQPGPLANLVEYLNAGGRVFTTHYSYVWLTYPGSPFNVVGAWNPDQTYLDSVTGTVDASFPKGMAFSTWLQNVGATTTPGQLDITDGRHDIDSVNPIHGQRWISLPSPQAMLHMTFNTPIDAPLDPDGNPMYCGKVVYSDFHVAASEADFLNPFPTSCMAGDLTGQEKALAFMLFDLSACVQKDNEQPIP
jgi:hypothetical protein